MKFAFLSICTLVAGLFAPGLSFAAVSTADDRISLSADGASLTGTGGGGGVAAGWLHNFDTDTLAGVAVEHQVLGNAHWTFGSLNGALSHGQGDQRYSVYGEAHEGGGDDGQKAFKYSIVAAGVYGTFYHKLSVQLEDKQIDVEATHGNLPKLGLSYLAAPTILVSGSYSYSVSGNLGTRLSAVRLDNYGPAFNLFAGASWGQASPVIVLNLQTDVIIPGRNLREGYVGVTKPFPHQRSELTVVGDYQDLSGIKHATVTVSYIFHVGGAGKPR